MDPLALGGLDTRGNNNKHHKLYKHYTKREDEESSMAKIS